MKFLRCIILVTLGLPIAALVDAFILDGLQCTAVAAGYTFARSNAPPDESGCFPMNGGSICVAQPFKSEHLALVFDTTIEHASSAHDSALKFAGNVGGGIDYWVPHDLDILFHCDTGNSDEA